MKKAPRFYGPSRPPRHGRPPTERQRAARDRNWRIFKLRGLYWIVAGALTGERLATARAAVDTELDLLGAENVTARRAREEREAAAYETFRAALIGDLTVF